MQEAEKLSLEEIRQLLEASEGIRFAGVKRAQAYSWIELVLCEQEYARQGKSSRGLLRRYIEKMTGMSRAQVTRLMGRYIATGRVVARAYRRTALLRATRWPMSSCWPQSMRRMKR